MPESASTPLIAADSPSATTNAGVVLDFFARALGTAHDLGAVADLLDPGFVDHDPAGDDSGLAGVTAKLAGLWSMLPDGRYQADAVVAAGDLVMVRSRLMARVSVSGVPALEVAFADTYRVVDGRIREHWHVVDGGALAAALAG